MSLLSAFIDESGHDAATLGSDPREEADATGSF
jgi:hypothetical protein